MYISKEKKDEAHKRLIGTCKFFGIFLPIFLFWMLPIYIKAHQEIPTYIRDCRTAQTYPNKPTTNVPCYYETANATLKSYYKASGVHDSQTVRLDFADGSTAVLNAHEDPGIWYTDSQIDGPCQVQYWHGVIRKMKSSTVTVQSEENPLIKADFVGGLLSWSLIAATIGIWIYLLYVYLKPKSS